MTTRLDGPHRRNPLHLLAWGWLLAAATALADPLLEPELNEQLLTVPPQAREQPTLQASLFLPDGPGPFPVVVMNHGRQEGATRRQPRWRPTDLVRHWQQRGWAVYLPMRAGFADSGGPDDDVACPDIAARARGAGAQLHRAIDALAGRPELDLGRLVVLGHSEGMLTALGYATATPHAGLKAVINLAGGLRSGLGWCRWQDSLAEGLQTLARQAPRRPEPLPMQWLYAANDSFFDHALARRWAQAWADGGGQAHLLLLPALGPDGHEAVLREPAQALLWAQFTTLLGPLGLPTQVVQPRFADTTEPMPRASGYARIDSVRDVPHLSERRREVYSNFLTQPRPRAVAISEDGAIGWASDIYKPQRAALRFCQRSAAPGRPCRLYAVDDTVVWTESPAPPRPVANPEPGARP